MALPCMAVAAAAVPTTCNYRNIGPAASAKCCADAGVHGQATGSGTDHCRRSVSLPTQCLTAYRCMAVAHDTAQMVLLV